MAHDFELDGYPVKVHARPLRRRWRSGLLAAMRLGLASCLLVVICYLLIPRVYYCDWERARQTQCASNLRQIWLALDSYHQRYGVLPPAYVADANGRPMHSWRVLILPFLDPDYLPLYEQYDFTEPWDGPHNRKLLAKMPGEFRCPSPPRPRPVDTTNYAVITGPGTMFPGTKPVKFSEVTDGAAYTLMVAETTTVDIPWTAPADLDLRTMSFRLNDPDQRGISSKHAGGANIICGDGHAYFVKDRVDARRLRSLITIAGADGYPYDDGSPSF